MLSGQITQNTVKFLRDKRSRYAFNCGFKDNLAGALQIKTGWVSYVVSSSKRSELFIELLEHLRGKYLKAKTITLIVDNYIIHKSRKTAL